MSFIKTPFLELLKTLCNSPQKFPILFSFSILHDFRQQQTVQCVANVTSFLPPLLSKVYPIQVSLPLECMFLNILSFFQSLHDFVFHINLLSLPVFQFYLFHAPSFICFKGPPREKCALLFRVTTRKNMHLFLQMFGFRLI